MAKDIIQHNLDMVAAHFHSEELNEVEEALKLYTDDIVWEAPARNLKFIGKEDVGNNYRRMFASAEGVTFRTLQRFATEDRVVDDSIVTLKLTGDGFENFPVPVGSNVEMRLVHIFEMRDGLISREIAFEMPNAV